MSSSYKINDPFGIYYITFATVEWVDVFTRREYKDLFVESLRFCQQEKGLTIYSWVLMTNHVHMIVSAKNGDLSNIIRDLKGFTNRKLLKEIDSFKESRKNWMLEIFRRAGHHNSNNKIYQLWQQDNHPKQILTNRFGQQKLDYIHNNPVSEGLVENVEDYLYSSARSYSGLDGMLEVEYME